ncbi:MAG TPA: hypothetical protein VL944_00155 [Candidatus Acidoferrum sp.]|nr:hypothetical protein [Candidatus Acidoferrum sp.]
MEEHRLIRNIVFRLIRRHIAGSTMNSALNAVKSLNGKGMNTTLTFLSESVPDPIKARYNANTYVQLARQISRLHLNASLSVRLSQIGFTTGTDSAGKLLDGILDASSSTVWLEGGPGVTNDQLMEVYNQKAAQYKNLGVEVPLSYYGRMDGIAKRIRPKGLVRITSRAYMAEQKHSDDKKAYKNVMKSYMDTIGMLLKRSQKVFIHEPNDHLIAKIASGCNGHRNDLIFGIPFGYSARKVKELIKKRVNLDVYVPYGKDWASYAVYGLAGSRMRGIAMALLDGKAGGENGIPEE